MPEHFLTRWAVAGQSHGRLREDIGSSQLCSGLSGAALSVCNDLLLDG